MKKVLTYSLIGIFSGVVILGICFFSFRMIYPIAYKNEIEKYAIETSIDKALIYAVIKAESSFKANAKSSKDAMGLMQLKEETAKYVCELNSFEYITNKEELFKPELNIKLVTYYLKYLINKFDGNLKYALIAYNAGETKTREWINSGEFDKNCYKISLNYYKNVLKYKKIYNKIV